MNTRRVLYLAGPALLVVASMLAMGCGSGTHHRSARTSPPATTTPSPPASTTVSPSLPALTVEAQQTAAGDIPDNQVFLTFHNAGGGYSVKYPEGWARRGSAARVIFQDKNNLVRIEVAKGAGVTVQGARIDMNRLKRQTPTLRFSAPARMTVGGKPVVKVVYSTKSAPNPVTGKRVTLVVDRYYVPGIGKHAVLDLGTPQGVDNVDAYRLMIESFRWK